MVKDTVSDLIVILKNASMVGKSSVTLPFTKLAFEISKVLKKANFIADVEEKGDKIKQLEITLKYDEETKAPAINDVKRISKLSKRVYKNVKEIHSVKNGHGILVLSTPEGILSDKDARKNKVGGEALFEIW